MDLTFPIAKHFEEGAMRGFQKEGLASLKATLSKIYVNLASIEPEIKARRKPRRR